MKRIAFILAFSFAALAQQPKVTTWNGLVFGMSKDEVKAALKDSHLELQDSGDTIKASGAIENILGDDGDIRWFGKGSASLTFQGQGLSKVRLTFDFAWPDYVRDLAANYSACQADASLGPGQYSNDPHNAPGMQALQAREVAQKYRKRYGKPLYEDGTYFPGDGSDNSPGDERWSRDMVHQKPWAYEKSWKWNENRQEVFFHGQLVCRGAQVTVDYSPENQNHKF